MVCFCRVDMCVKERGKVKTCICQKSQGEFKKGDSKGSQGVVQDIGNRRGMHFGVAFIWWLMEGAIWRGQETGHLV